MHRLESCWDLFGEGEDTMSTRVWPLAGPWCESYRLHWYIPSWT